MLECKVIISLSDVADKTTTYAIDNREYKIHK